MLMQLVAEHVGGVGQLRREFLRTTRLTCQTRPGSAGRQFSLKEIWQPLLVSAH